MVLITVVWVLMVLNGWGHPILNGLVGVAWVAVCSALLRRHARG